MSLLFNNTEKITNELKSPFYSYVLENFNFLGEGCSLDNHYILAVENANGVIVSFRYFYIVGHTCVLFGVATDPSVQNTGLATETFKQAIKKANNMETFNFYILLNSVQTQQRDGLNNMYQRLSSKYNKEFELTFECVYNILQTGEQKGFKLS